MPNPIPQATLDPFESAIVAGVAFVPGNDGPDPLDSLQYAPRTVLVVANTGVVDRRVVIPAYITSRPADASWPPLTVPDLNVSVPAGATIVIGPFAACYANGLGKIIVSYDNPADLNVFGVTVV